MARSVGFAIITGFILSIAAPASAQDKAERGSAVFAAQKCTMCHSIAGKGNKKGALDDVGARLKAEEIRQWLTSPETMREKTHASRTPAMKDPKLPKDQLDALVAYLQTQKRADADNAR